MQVSGGTPSAAAGRDPVPRRAAGTLPMNSSVPPDPGHASRTAFHGIQAVAPTSDSRVWAFRASTAQDPRSRGTVRHSFRTRATEGGDPVARVQGKWLRFCKTPVRTETFQTSLAHVRQRKALLSHMCKENDPDSAKPQLRATNIKPVPHACTKPSGQPTHACEPAPSFRPPRTRRCREGHGSAPPGSQRGPSAWLSLAASPKLIRRGLVISANQC